MGAAVPRRGLIARRHQRRISWLILAILLFVLWRNLPTDTDRKTPQYGVAEKPRFLYHSRFRENPNHEYEARVNDALGRIEKRVLFAEKGDIEARKRIWQIMLAKDAQQSDDSLNFEAENDDWEYELVTRSSGRAFVKDIFSEVPDLIWAYDSYPHDVLRADLLRYLLLWYHGGYYADMDVSPVLSIEDCAPLSPLFDDDDDIDPPSSKPIVFLVIGIEIDEPYASPNLMRKWRWIRTYGFGQYTMYAPRRFSPLLRRAIARVLAQTRQHYQSASWVERYWRRVDEATILELTGPGVFTDAILDGLSDALPATHPLVRTSVEMDYGGELSAGPRVTWAPFYRLKESLWLNASDAVAGREFGGLGVMPIRVWGNGQRHSQAGWYDDEEACVNHHFRGTWKPWKQTWSEYLFGS